DGLDRTVRDQHNDHAARSAQPIEARQQIAPSCVGLDKTSAVAGRLDRGPPVLAADRRADQRFEGIDAIEHDGTVAVRFVAERSNGITHCAEVLERAEGCELETARRAVLGLHENRIRKPGCQRRLTGTWMTINYVPWRHRCRDLVNIGKRFRHGEFSLSIAMTLRCVRVALARCGVVPRLEVPTCLARLGTRFEFAAGIRDSRSRRRCDRTGRSPTSAPCRAASWRFAPLTSGHSRW